jgi:hypothetical protein
LPSSLTRVISNTLGHLSLSTRVGLRYGRSCVNDNEAFLDGRDYGQVASDFSSTSLYSQLNIQGGFTCPGVALFRERTMSNRCAWLSFRVPPLSQQKRYGNNNPLSIAYASRPQLRSRLTLRGLALRRKPQTFGGRVSHTPCATHSGSLTSLHSTAAHAVGFIAKRTLPYPPLDSREAIASVVCLSPAGFSAQDHSTSELLRTL